MQYFFVSREVFQQMITEGAFVEYDYHMDNYYGTLKAEIFNKTANGHMILDIEPVGALNVKSIYPDATLIYIAPPSMEVLMDRLRSRNDTPEEQIKIRSERAAWESAQQEKYDYVVINDVLEDCIQEVLAIIEKHTKE